MAINYLSKPFFLATLICILVFYSGIFAIPEQNCFYSKYNSSIISNSNVNEITGMIISSPVKSSSGKTYSAKFKILNRKSKYYSASISENTNNLIKVYIPAEMVEVYFPGKLYSKINRKGAFLYESGGIYVFEGNFTKSTNNFIVSDCKKCIWQNNIIGKIDYFRALCRLQFKRLMFAFGNSGGLLLALLSGAREYTDGNVSYAFKNAGLSHILALSGMHLSMFSTIALFFGNKMGRKKISFIFRLFILIIFVWFAGFSPSLLRAFICSMLLLFSTVAGIEKPDMVMILCFSFMLQSIISPSDIQNAGFMLSYGALAGILLTGSFFYKLFSRFLPYYFSSSLGASAGAQLFTLPVSLSLFGCFAPIGIIATVFISPLISIFIYTGIILIIVTLIFPFVFPCSEFFISIEYNVIKFLVEAFSQVPIWSIN